MLVSRKDAKIISDRNTIIIELDENEATKLITVLRVGITMFGLFDYERSVGGRLHRILKELLGVQ